MIAHSLLLTTMMLATLIVVALSIQASPETDDPVQVLNPVTIGADRLPAQRIPLGVPGDYKPCLA